MAEDVSYRKSYDSYDISDQSKIANLDRERNEERIVKAVRAAVEDVLSSKNYQRFVRQFQEAWEFYKGVQWLDENLEEDIAPSWRFRAVRNITFSTIRSIEGLIADSRPIPYVVADIKGDSAEDFLMRKLGQFDVQRPTNRELLDEYLAKKLTDILHAEYERRNEELLLGQVLSDCVVGGLGVRKVTWDTNLQRSACPQIFPPDVLIDPYCSDHELNTAKYIVFRKTMDAEDLMYYYDLSKNDVKNIIESSSKYDCEFEGGIFGEIRPKSPFKDGYTPRGGNSVQRVRVDVYEMWFFGSSLYEVEHESDANLKHPNGRVIVVAGDYLIYDSPNPYPHGMFPFVFFRNYGDPRDPYGFGDVLPIRGDQISINVILSQIVMNLILMANSQWIFEEGAILKDWLTNRPGLAIEVPRGMVNSVRKVEGSQIPPALFQVLTYLENSVKNISNINELVQGAMPQTHTPALAITASQNAALLRIREKSKQLEAAYKRQAYMEIRNIQEFSTWLLPLSRGEMDMGEWLYWEDRMRGLTFDIQVESKVGQPANLLDKFQFAMQLLQSGAIDPLGIISYVELPVEERYKKKLELADEIQLLQGLIVREQLRAQLTQLQVQMQQQQLGQVNQQNQVTPGGLPNQAEQPTFPTQPNLSNR
ncbi:MAG: hypothetical protein QXO25_02255 [Candidatus Bathyarchaeia archaeon]